MPELVRLSEIAKRLGIDISTARRVLSRFAADLGLAPVTGKQNVIFLSTEDAERLVSFYESRATRSAISPPTDSVAYQRFGYFYLIQLVPEALPLRVEISYTDNLDARIAEHRCVAPTARLVKSWPCKRSWDYAAMDSITRTGCHLVLNEVYEGDLQGFIDRADGFFAQMPQSDLEKPLSVHSPLRADDESRDT